MFDAFKSDGITSSRTHDEEIGAIIKRVHEQYGYLVDPHTACGFAGEFDGPQIILATAHPAKFPDTIVDSIQQNATHPSLETLKQIEPVKYTVEPTPVAIKAFMRSH